MRRYLERFNVDAPSIEISEADAHARPAHAYDVAEPGTPRHIVIVLGNDPWIVNYPDAAPSLEIETYHQSHYPDLLWRIYSPVTHDAGVERYTEWTADQRSEYEITSDRMLTTWYSLDGVLGGWLSRRYDSAGIQIDVTVYDAKTGRTHVED